ncbi:MAG: helix-turn-helix domain-containing protein [Tenericutes bacterium]|nr:helix-turn-helix domain-containing protein [Mycoplasmatota bacterium]MBI9009680.1 helix-turn-helix domain-containing protein [Mycoplasmatota bacterium]
MNEKSYINWQSMSDSALGEKIGTFLKHHRIEQNRTQDEVAENAGISRSTLSLLEKGQSVSVATLLRVLRVLDLLNIMEIFKVEKQMSPIELAKLEQKTRQRASKVSYVKEQPPKSSW